MIHRNKNGKLETKSKQQFVPDDDVVNRMHALIGLVRNQDEDLIEYKNVRYAMDVLLDMMPVAKQVELYLTPEEKIRVLSDSKTDIN